MGLGTCCNVLHLFDLGLAKLFWNSTPNAHILFRLDWVLHAMPVSMCTLDMVCCKHLDALLLTYAYPSCAEQGHHDDIKVIGNLLLFLLHRHLPWQGLYAPSVQAKLLCIGEMKAGSEFADLLLQSPPEFTQYFEHCCNLAFQEQLHYQLLKEIFQKRVEQEHWSYDGIFDLVGGMSEKGILLLDKYQAEPRFIDLNVDFDW